MFLVLCELAVHFTIAMSSQTGDNAIVTRQLGPQICVKLCSAHGGCQSLTFDPDELRCTLEIMAVMNRQSLEVNLTSAACSTGTRYPRTIHTGQGRVGKRTQMNGVPRNKTTNRRDDGDSEGTGTSQKRGPKNNLELIPFPMTWYKAWDYCKSRHWDLVMPKEEEDCDDLSKYILSKYTRPIKENQQFWFGVRNVPKKNAILWVDGERLVNPNFMLQMSRFGSKECGRFSFHRYTSKLINWIGRPCYNKIKFICQK